MRAVSRVVLTLPLILGLPVLGLLAAGCPDDGMAGGGAGSGAQPRDLEPGDDGPIAHMVAEPGGPAPEPPQMDDDQAAAQGDDAMEMTEVDAAEPIGDAAEPGKTPGDAVPGAADAPADPTGAGAVDACDLSHTRVHLDDGAQVTEGTLCDDVVVCAESEAAASALVAAVPDFDCETGENVIGLCADDDLPCVWRPGEIDAAEAQQVCDATAVLQDDTELVCVVYR
jgi:hypothetical protein